MSEWFRGEWVPEWVKEQRRIADRRFEEGSSTLQETVDQLVALLNAHRAPRQPQTPAAEGEAAADLAGVDDGALGDAAAADAAAPYVPVETWEERHGDVDRWVGPLPPEADFAQGTGPVVGSHEELNRLWLEQHHGKDAPVSFYPVGERRPGDAAVGGSASQSSGCGGPEGQEDLVGGGEPVGGDGPASSSSTSGAQVGVEESDEVLDWEPDVTVDNEVDLDALDLLQEEYALDLLQEEYAVWDETGDVVTQEEFAFKDETGDVMMMMQGAAASSSSSSPTPGDVTTRVRAMEEETVRALQAELQFQEREGNAPELRWGLATWLGELSREADYFHQFIAVMSNGGLRCGGSLPLQRVPSSAPARERAVAWARQFGPRFRRILAVARHLPPAGVPGGGGDGPALIGGRGDPGSPCGGRPRARGGAAEHPCGGVRGRGG